MRRDRWLMKGNKWSAVARACGAVGTAAVAAGAVFMAGAASAEDSPAGSSRRVLRLASQQEAAPVENKDGRPQCPTREELEKNAKAITQITVDINPAPPAKGDSVDRPENCAEELLKQANFAPIYADMPRGFAETAFNWEAPQSVTYPLYFEDAPLERYGQTVSPIAQPFISGARFFATIPILPYKMALDRPLEVKYLLGYYRPGSCAPFVRERLPVRADAVVFQGLVVTGLVFLIP